MRWIIPSGKGRTHSALRQYGCIKYAFSIPFTRPNFNVNISGCEWVRTSVWVSELSLRKYLLVLASCSSLLSLAKRLKADLQFSWSRIYVGNSNTRERERGREGGVNRKFAWTFNFCLMCYVFRLAKYLYLPRNCNSYKGWGQGGMCRKQELPWIMCACVCVQLPYRKSTNRTSSYFAFNFQAVC